MSAESDIFCLDCFDFQLKSLNICLFTLTTLSGGLSVFLETPLARVRLRAFLSRLFHHIGSILTFLQSSSISSRDRLGRRIHICLNRTHFLLLELVIDLLRDIVIFLIHFGLAFGAELLYFDIVGYCHILFAFFCLLTLG